MRVEAGEVDLLVRESEGDPEGALILNHGRATDEHDLLPLLDALDPERRLLGVSTGAPFRGIPPGGRHWYVVERIGYPHPETFHHSYEMLGTRIDDLLAERGIDHAEMAIGGFSQGSVMAYALALGEGRPTPGALLVMSGFIPEVEGWTPDLVERDGLRVLVYHGSADPIIGVDYAHRAVARLADAGIDHEHVEAPVGHGIAQEAVEAGARILAGVGAASRS